MGHLAAGRASGRGLERRHRRGRRLPAQDHGAAGGGRTAWSTPWTPTRWCRRSTSPAAAGVWRFDTKNEDDDSTNIGGGLAVDQGTLYAVNGLAELVALDAAKGTVRWRRDIGAPAPLGADRGRGPAVPHHHRGQAAGAARPRTGGSCGRTRRPIATTSVLGRPAPAYADGLVVAGFGSGEAGGAARRHRHVRVDRQPGGGAARTQPGRLLRGPRPAGDRRRAGLRHRHGRADGGARPADRAAAVGARGRPARTALGRRRLAVRRVARISGSPRSTARTAASPG